MQIATTIARARIQSYGLDPLAVRQRAAHLLGAGLADAQPAGMPPSAILCVRHLRDPLPGALSLQVAALRPPAQWTSALATSLEHHARRAARPALGQPAADAEAVLFIDRAELLACLAGDWCDGRLRERWWWRAMLRTLDASLEVMQAWLESPEDVPAASAALRRSGRAEAFVGRLTEHQTSDLLTRMLAAHGLHHLHAMWIDLQASNLPQANEIAGAEAPTSFVLANESDVRERRSPWQFIAPEIDFRRMGVARACLLGMGLMLNHAPAEARTPAFAQAVIAWWRAKRGDSASIRMPPQSDSRRQANGPALRPARDPGATQVVQPDSTAEGTLTTHTAAEGAVPAAGLLTDTPELQHGRDALRLQAATPESREQEKTHVDAIVRSPLDLPIDNALEINTAFGGLFYLINLGLFMRFYADFTQPLAASIPLNLYDFVAWVGEGMFEEDQRPALRTDPVWVLLAHLAGHDPDAAVDMDALEPGWLALWLPQLRARLCQAFGFTDSQDDKERHLLPHMLFEHPARVRVSATHLDVFFALDTLPIQIRLSGLDRDPGWVPAAGRFVKFHYA